MAEDQITEDIMLGRYVVVDTKPKLLCSLGAVPKHSGSVRLIHDCSRPKDVILYSYTSTLKFKYQTTDDAVKLYGSKGGCMAKMDIRSVCRAIPIHKDCYEATGLKRTQISQCIG